MLLSSIICIFLWVEMPVTAALTEPERGNANVNAIRDNNTNSGRDFNPETGLDAFEKATEHLAGSQARLGDELATLPGPNINFQSLMRLVITWSASLAASVALYLLVWSAFRAISGTEEAHNQLKQTLIKVIVGMALVLFSYVIVSFIMGIIWAS
ncbi:hypothetical protein COW36_24940 [bacterium (Candidatus Blackallbacteria) CG17_big_fil_post_rev_8_21_14_2_50_48_46]|uniref:DUF5671 domain-containing protein n=1 Tax=bacterium (Candidatus Blackallbacteria) CG17_big_fil_post_rev_8_21_14_2_50_48_46 TaxID=2014261 RepID=A0A2M7FXF2_9BACT|nr:MAG: hypothetical protein COW64_07945 [bacterium (Candidatus Blackallbacteria) CG18_big_fil_WC_8_21_14_2_50_49_26]PIW13651.1 MAG: hypothetical protein COW36_24940 [bacterium (Candidatus Blackallbacteria) CG17_big_fil_post_rev_8_21_14_2_50_48_46]PIW49173.1 MAG: hypothetical protein COW20_06770 [bacterium (Candidatus Blackallbacteria) CG13_big_fil_rev_8_21_14_2_50_49_14]